MEEHVLVELGVLSGLIRKHIYSQWFVQNYGILAACKPRELSVLNSTTLTVTRPCRPGWTWLKSVMQTRHLATQFPIHPKSCYLLQRTDIGKVEDLVASNLI